MIYVGIDPGLDGGIAIIGESQVFLYDIPTINEKTKKGYRRRYDIQGICNIFRSEILKHAREEVFVILEKAQPMPAQGVTSMFSTGFGFGIYQGILSAFSVPYEIIHSKKWQKIFSIAGDTKAKSFEVSQRLFPDLEFVTKRGRILTGRCDSILLAEYGRRLYSK